MNKIAKLLAVAGFIGVAQAADLTWTGAESATWDATALNWQDAGGTACAWADGSTAVFPTGGTITNITVSGEVKPYRLIFAGGQWSFGGNSTLRVTDGRFGQKSVDPTVGVTFKEGLTVCVGTGVAGTSVDMNIANVTIENASFLCPSNRYHNSWNSSNVIVQPQGIVNIGDGGLFECKDLVLTSQAATTADKQDLFRFNVTTGGILRIAYLYNFHLNYYGKINVDGGDIQSLTGNNKRSIYSGNTPTPSNVRYRIVLGPGGWVSKGNKFVGMLLEGGPGDGGVTIASSSPSHTYLKNGSAHNVPESTFTGGVHMLKNAESTAFLINGDRNLGAVPDVPTTNIYVEGNFALMSEGVSAVLHSNRIIRIESNRKLQLAGNSTRITVCGPIVGTAPNTAANGIVTTYNPYWKTHVELAPAVNVTNKFGRLLVQKYNLTHGGAGVTEVDQVTSVVEGHTGSFDVWDGATLAVTSGTLRVVNGTWAANCGYVDVSGGLLDTSGIKYEYLNAFRVPGTTTVSRAGRFLCNAYRMAEGSQIARPEMGLTRLVTNGVLQLTYFNMTYANLTLNSRAQLDWDGGIAATRGTAARYDFLGPNTADKTLLQSWRDRVMVYVREGGAVVSNNCEIRIRQPLLCGVPEGKTDGGFTKWGTGMMAFVDNLVLGDGTFNTFNGPINVEQGTLTMGSVSNFLPTAKLYVRAGATFNGNAMLQTFSTLGGTGNVTNPSKLTLTDAFAPGYGTNTIGTLTVAGALGEVKDGAELQIDLDAEGHSDCLSYAAALDLSKLRLVVNDLNKLNTDCKYVIATNLTSCANAFASSNLPNGWYVKQSTSGGRVSLTLAFKKGTTFIVR